METFHKMLKRTKTVYAIVTKCIALGLTVFIVASLSACSFIPKEEEVLAPPLKEPPKVAFNTMEVKRGTIIKKDECFGQFISVKQTDLSFTARGGRIKKIYVKLGDEVRQGDIIAELDTDDLADQIKQQGFTLEKAKVKYESKIEGVDTTMDIRLSKLEMDSEKAKLEAMHRQLESAKLTSAIDGIIDYIITEVREGDNIEAFKTVVRVADPKDLQVEYANQEKLNDFSLGAAVSIGYNNETVTGKVVMTPSNVPQNADEKTKTSIRIKPDKPINGARIGETANLTLVLEKKDNVIIIDKRYIHNTGARKYVNILVNDLKKEQDIQTGIESDAEAEVLSGLSEKDRIIKD